MCAGEESGQRVVFILALVSGVGWGEGNTVGTDAALILVFQTSL